MLAYYDCSDLPSQRYDVTFLNQTVNQRPYCAELYNPQDLPYAFHFFPLKGKPNGFPVYFDINLSQGGAQVRQQTIDSRHTHLHATGIACACTAWTQGVQCSAWWARAPHGRWELRPASLRPPNCSPHGPDPCLAVPAPPLPPRPGSRT